MSSILNRELSWVITSFGNKFSLKKRSRLIKALDNRFFAKFMQLEIGILFCNCPLFVIALVPGLFFGGKPDETCCHSVVASKWLETQVSHFALQDENTTT